MEGITYLNDQRAKKPEDEVDSSEEEEIKEAKQSKFDIEFDTAKAIDMLKANPNATILICGMGNPQALLRILLDAELEEAGEVKATQKEWQKEGSVEQTPPKPKSVLKVYTHKSLVVLFV